ncbi:MAG: type II toxin-antitoxin system VapC family toxin [Acidobacteriaceae bacterium]
MDTHLLLCAAASSRRLPRGVAALIRDEANELFFSVARLWEIAIKGSPGRRDFRVDARVLRRGLLDHGYVELAITGLHAIEAGALPWLHRDPFDRMLVAQCVSEGIPLLTVDERLRAYGAAVKVF